MITTPTLLLDKKRCLGNIHRMSEKAKRNGLDFRPHFKTHQSHTVGQWFRAIGVTKIATSSLTMAAYFAEDGWDDITVAFPTNILEIETINKLASKIKLNLLIQSEAVLAYLAEHLSHPINAFIKIDLGYGRTGIQATDFQTLDHLINEINTVPNIHFTGFLGHAGHSYDVRGLEGIKAVHQEALANMNTVFQHYKESYPSISISMGDTPTCSTMESFGCATELRPGNFVFYDLTQERIGSCRMEDIAVALTCPVVAIHPERNEIIIYGGGVHFSKEVYTHDNYGKCYGLVVNNNKNDSWSTPITDVYLHKVSQEHGVIKCTSDFIKTCKIGALLKILPVHSCMTADLLKRMVTTAGEEVSMMHYI
jgi:D-serine deaminase-like pyridoxal phosphate-dependent protein